MKGTDFPSLLERDIAPEADMSDYADRLQKCFAVVFPALDVAEIRNASVTSVGDWDSLANVNLLCVLEEEFNIEIAAGELEALTSFPAILRYLETRR
jgi:acyl carrier protein